MIYQNAEIVINASRGVTSCTVNSQTLLADVAHHYLNSPHAYLLVEDDQGCPVGIVGLDDIERRLNSSSVLERRRWMNMPVEAAMNGRFSLTRKASESLKSMNGILSAACTAVAWDGRRLAVVTDDDVLVSWRSIEQMLRQAQNDHVTGLPTRSAFDSQLRAECSRAGRNSHSVGVILIDIDLFKQINDQFGHAAGDAVLSSVGKTLRRTFRSYDMVARFGGDEFAVICCGCRPGEIDLTIDRLRNGMQRLQSDLSIPQSAPTLSIGSCVMHDPDQIETPDQIVQAADECLYFAKRAGRNRSFSTELGVESFVTC